MAQALTDSEVELWRARFPILSRCTYLINNSLGAMPDTVPASLLRFADQWGTLGVQAWTSDWLPEVRRVADLLGGLIGAPAGSVTLHQNVAALTAIVVSALDLRKGRDTVVLAADDWPGHRYLAEGLPGARVVVARGDGLLYAVDERTALVLAGHVAFRSSAIVDVAAVCARAREVGALSMVDGYHAVGVLPVDVTALGCDLYVGGSVKWLCGGPGVAYLFVRPGLEQTLRPVNVGWLGHAAPFDFDEVWTPAGGALGWLGGTPAIPAIASAREGYAIVAEVGSERIRATSQRLTQHLVEGALERGIAVHSPLRAEDRAGAVALSVGEDTQRAAERLIAAGIVVDYRPEPARSGVVRVGPHFFSTTAEVDRVLANLRP